MNKFLIIAAFFVTSNFSFGQIYTPAGNVQSTTINNGQVGIGTNNPLGKLHIHSSSSDVLLVNPVTEEIAIIGGGTGWKMPDFAIRVMRTDNGLGHPVTPFTTYSVTPSGKVKAGVFSFTPYDQLSIRSNIGVYRTSTQNIKINYTSTPELVWNSPTNTNFSIKHNSGNVPLTLSPSGKVGINTDDISGGHSLYVEGSVIAEEIFVKLKADWPDYVFESEYELMPLLELENFIQANKHLPGMTPALL